MSIKTYRPTTPARRHMTVSGFDGVEIARYVIPSITTVRQPTEEIAQKSVDLLCEMLDGGPARHVTVGYTLVEGEDGDVLEMLSLLPLKFRMAVSFSFSSAGDLP